MSQAKPASKQLNLKGWAMQTDLKVCGCPTKPESILESRAVYRLDMQQALLGRATSDLRHVGIDIDPDKKKLIAHFIYDGEISELNRHLAITAIQDSRVSFADYEVEFFIERVDYPQKMNHHGKLLAYWRREWIFTDNGPIPAIHK